jgi:hypothetical protein
MVLVALRELVGAANIGDVRRVAGRSDPGTYAGMPSRELPRSASPIGWPASL